MQNHGYRRRKGIKSQWQPCSASRVQTIKKKHSLETTPFLYLRGVYQRRGSVRISTHPRQGPNVQPQRVSWLPGDNTLTLPYCTLHLPPYSHSFFFLFFVIFTVKCATKWIYRILTNSHNIGLFLVPTYYSKFNNDIVSYVVLLIISEL